VFVIVYKEVSNDFTPVDSQYAKLRLRGLHPNIHVQRSPSHTSTGTLLWSHVRCSMFPRFLRTLTMMT
jgi:phospholipase D1/2